MKRIVKINKTKQIQELTELLKKTLTCWGHSRGYWCRHCGGHVVEGHKPSCEIVIAARTLMPKVQVTQKDNKYYHHNATGLKSQITGPELAAACDHDDQFIGEVLEMLASNGWQRGRTPDGIDEYWRK